MQILFFGGKLIFSSEMIVSYAPAIAGLSRLDFSDDIFNANRQESADKGNTSFENLQHSQGRLSRTLFL